MSETLEARGEVLKLARLLAVEEADLAFLEELPSADLRAFREAATDRLFDANSKLLDRIAAAAKLIPSALVATIAQRAFGPLLCARAAGAVDTAKAIDVAKRLPADFLADTAVELDPRRVAAIIAAVPEELVVPVARELGGRREYVAMGRFLAFVPDHAIVGAMGVLDDEALLRTAFVLEHKDRLDHAIGLLPDERLPTVLRRATDLNLWPEALDLLDQLSTARRGPIADIVAGEDPEVITAIVHAVAEGNIWDSLLPVVGDMSPDSRRRLAAVPVFHELEVMRQILAAAAVQDLWHDLVPLIDAVPEHVRGPVVDLVADQGDTIITDIVRVVAEDEMWDSLLPIVRSMSQPARERLAAVPVFHESKTMEAIVRAAAAQGLWIDLVPLIDALPSEALAQLPAIAAALDTELLRAVLVAAASAPDALPPLLRIAADMDAEERQVIVEAIDTADESLAHDLADRFADPTVAGPLLAMLTDDISDAISRAAEKFGLEDTLAHVRGDA